MKQLVGWILMSVGALMATLCGLCTLGFSASALMNLFSAPSEALTFLVLVALVGGVPTAIGFAIFQAGRSALPRKDATLEEGQDD